jgi:hypothetical protein
MLIPLFPHFTAGCQGVCKRLTLRQQIAPSTQLLHPQDTYRTPHRTFYASSHLPLPRLVTQNHCSKHRYRHSRWPITASRLHDSPLLELVDSVAVCRAPIARHARIRRPICTPSPHLAAPTGTRAPVRAPRTMSLPLLPRKVQVPSVPRTQ